MRRYVFLNARKLARKLGVSRRKAAYILRRLAEAGVVEVWSDRRGRFKVYVIKN